MGQKVRKAIIIITLLLFPVIMNYLSPYVPLDGAMNGIIAGSLIMFLLLFITAIFFGRAWCGWLCPMAGLSEMAAGVNSKNVNIKKLRVIRYCIFAVWAGLIITMFIMAGGIKGIDPLHLTENVISVDAPAKYIIYYMVLAIFLVLSISIGKRGACHAICWMSPFLTAGHALGRLLKFPQLRIRTDSSKCVDCKVCDKNCPMSIPVSESVKDGYIKTSDCILCGICTVSCKKNVLSYGVNKRPTQTGGRAVPVGFESESDTLK